MSLDDEQMLGLLAPEYREYVERDELAGTPQALSAMRLLNEEIHAALQFA